jgi:RNA polymerase sigma-70 factor (ECF subfamily)
LSPSQLTDAILVEKAQRGDRSAIDELVDRYQGRAYQFAYRLTSNSDDASDLVAEAFVRVYSALPRFRRESQFSTWFYRIITNCFLDQKKREKSRQTTSLDDIQAAEIPSDEGVGSPEEFSEQGERDEIMRRAIGSLPEYQRAMIVMYHVEMLSYEDIAQTMGMPIGTVKSRLNRARLALRDLLEPYEELLRG